jgi:hypothetical protein
MVVGLIRVDVRKGLDENSKVVQDNGANQFSRHMGFYDSISYV